jgi:hypothetical protein
MSYFGQIATVTAPLQATQAGGLLSTVTANTLNPSQTMTYLNTTQEVIGTKVFSRKILPKVGQPYALQMSDADVYREIYGGMPTASKRVPVAAGAEPQKILTMKSGLEIPADILERDMLRKQATAKETEILLNKRPSRLLQAGHFASLNPLQATVIALAVGAIAGSIFYDLQH